MPSSAFARQSLVFILVCSIHHACTLIFMTSIPYRVIPEYSYGDENTSTNTPFPQIGTGANFQRYHMIRFWIHLKLGTPSTASCRNAGVDQSVAIQLIGQKRVSPKHSDQKRECYWTVLIYLWWLLLMVTPDFPFKVTDNHCRKSTEANEMSSNANH